MSTGNGGCSAAETYATSRVDAHRNATPRWPRRRCIRELHSALATYPVKGVRKRSDTTV
jgi:hypothetical protein